MSKVLIECYKISKKYLKDKHSINIYENEILILVGENGSGKSTILKMLLSFIKPDYGYIKRSIDKISYLPEKMELPLFLTPYQYFVILFKIMNLNIDLALITKLNIPLFKKIITLSKGNMQKVALTATLIGNSKLVIFDEPLSGLDEITSKKLVELISLQKEKGKSFLIATHKPETFSSIKNRVINIC